jgi:hypothetical protein
MKKFSKVFIAAVISVMTFVLLAVSASAAVELGDINGDGNINVADARNVLRYAVDLDKPTTADQKTAADVNRDNDVTVADARLVLRVAVKLDYNFDNTKFSYANAPFGETVTSYIDGKGYQVTLPNKNNNEFLTFASGNCRVSMDLDGTAMEYAITDTSFYMSMPFNDSTNVGYLATSDGNKYMIAGSGKTASHLLVDANFYSAMGEEGSSFGDDDMPSFNSDYVQELKCSLKMSDASLITIESYDGKLCTKLHFTSDSSKAATYAYLDGNKLVAIEDVDEKGSSTTYKFNSVSSEIPAEMKAPTSSLQVTKLKGTKLSKATDYAKLIAFMAKLGISIKD